MVSTFIFVRHRSKTLYKRSYCRMKPICFVSAAFNEKRYIEQQTRLIESIDKYHPEAEGFHWTDELPPGAQPFLNSLYGFKVHAVMHAYNEGYERILFLDPACILLDRIDFLFELCPRHGVVAVKDDNKLPASNSALSHFGYRREDIADLHLVGGSVYAFNMYYSKQVFKEWYKSERFGIFGSQTEASSERLQGHRYDESCMALALHKHGFGPVGPDVARYMQGENSAIDKKHFK